MIVGVVGISGIVDHHCLIFFSHKNALFNKAQKEKNNKHAHIVLSNSCSSLIVLCKYHQY